MNIKNFFGLGNDDDTPSPPIADSLYKNLANNIYDIVKDIAPLLDNLDTNQRAYFLQDFSVIMVKATGPDLKEYHKFAFGILTYLIVQRDESIINSINTLPEKAIVKIVLSVFSSQENFFSKLTSDDYEYMLISFQILDDKDHDKLKRALYEFAEIVIKADGEVTPQEIKNLKELNHTHLNLSAPVTEVVQNDIKGGTTESEGLRTDTIDSILEELNDLVGLSNIKQDINSLINILKSNRMRTEQGLPEMKMSLHAVFMGPPGTGKTTIARLLSRIYSSLGVLPGNNFIETDRSGLVGGYVGQTAIKTDKLINEALNGVLFIDEAYTLSRGSDNDYGQEAIDTILKRMEDHRDKLAVIVAGYENEMNGFIDSNPGLQSRFSRYFKFTDYAPQQLLEIFTKMSKKAGFELTVEAKDKLQELFTVLYNNRNDRFGNARLVRNIFEKTFEKHANRTASVVPVTRQILTTIEEADIPFNEFKPDNGE